MDDSAQQISWGLCVATYNRGDVLGRCVQLALAQSLQPSEIVIVDASDDWQTNRDRIAALLVGHDGVRFHHVAAERRSSAAQRNQGIGLSTADILFLIDDDSLMQGDCAAQVMSVYRADGSGQIVAVATTDLDRAPDETGGPAVAVKDGADQTAAGLADSRIGDLLMQHLLMISTQQRFLPYDRPERRWRSPDPQGFQPPARCVQVQFIGGYSLTARRSALLQERFDDGLVGSSIAEDLDACYRLGRHGALVRALDARLFHLQAASGRSKRGMAALFSVLNIAYFLRRHTTRPVLDFARYGVWYGRMLIAEILKDVLRRRWSLPQTRGVLGALAHLPGLLKQSPATVEGWYRDRQIQIAARG